MSLLPDSVMIDNTKDSLLLLSAHFLLSSEAFPTGSPLEKLLFAKDDVDCECTMVCLADNITNAKDEIPVIARIAAHDKPLVKDWICSTSRSESNQYMAMIDHLRSVSKVKVIPAPVGSKTWMWMTECNSADVYLRDFRRFQPTDLLIPPQQQHPSSTTTTTTTPSIIHTKTFARIGLMGNPSDGFNGKTLSMLISNFWADVTLIPHSDSRDTRIVFERNYVLDPNVFESAQEISHVVGLDGYQGAMPLFLALIRVFVSWCAERKIELKSSGFRVFCSTNIPR